MAEEIGGDLYDLGNSLYNGDLGGAALAGTSFVIGKLPGGPAFKKIGKGAKKAIEAAENALGGAKKCAKAAKKPIRNISVQHNTRKAAEDAAAHAHKGKPRPTPPKSDTKKRRAYEEQQKYKRPETHPNSEHPESHFHNGNKSEQINRRRINVHHEYPS